MNNAKLSDDLRNYLESVPPVTKADLDGLEKAAMDLNNAPAFLAECSKEAFVENLIAERDALKAQVEELAIQNRILIVQRINLRYALSTLLDSRYGTATAAVAAMENAKAILADTAPKGGTP